MKRQRYNLVMAIYPNTRGFAFVLFEGPLSPVDWQVVEVRGRNRNRQCLRSIARLFGTYVPDVLVLQNMGEDGTRRARRIEQLNEAIETLAETQNISAFALSRAQVRENFSGFGLSTKQRIIEAIARQIPLFERFVPPVRRPWQSEDHRVALFEAAALALTYFEKYGNPQNM